MRETTILGQRVSAAVYNACLDLFDGNLTAAERWLTSPMMAFNGARPIDVAQTQPGEVEVLYLVRQLKQGIFS